MKNKKENVRLDILTPMGKVLYYLGGIKFDEHGFPWLIRFNPASWIFLLISIIITVFVAIKDNIVEFFESSVWF